MTFKLQSLILFAALSLLPQSLLAQKKSETCGSQIRAVFDLGSGTTKMQVAEVNPCTGKIHQKLRHESAKINVKEALAKSGKQTLDLETQEELTNQLSKFVREAKRLGAEDFFAVATAAYREAKNSKDIISEIEKQTPLKVKVISQKEEAELGFQAARSLLKLNPNEPLYVWDIGGGSQQLSSEKGPVYLGDLGSVGFKNLFIEKIQKASLKDKSSPNPISPDQARAGIELAETYAKEKIPKSVLQNFQKNPVSPAGLGGVLSISLPKQLKISGSYTKEDLQKLLELRANWTDQQIGGAYSATDLSNVILVLGFMKALNVIRIQPLELDLTEALLVRKTN